MALHELATNAGKYGSLSSEQGRVDIIWRINGAAAEAQFHMEWRESGGPPVEAPVTSGFGTKLIAHMTEIALQGSASLDYRTEGVAWSIEAPLCHITPAADDGAPWAARREPYPA
jgi:two-component sensor histidine kinase